MDWVAGFKALVSWLEDKHQIMSIFTAIAGLLLFLPWRVLSAMHIEGIAGRYRAAEWLVFMFGTMFLSYSATKTGWKHARQHKDIDDRLRNMTVVETSRVSEMLTAGEVTAWPHELGLETLHQNGILWREPGPYENRQFVYGLKDIARKRAIALKIGKR